MPKHTFIFNDESVNQYGFRILSAGIDLTRFENNPVVKVMHRRYDDWMPIGQASNLRINENNQLLGDIEFDQDDEQAVKIEKKVEKGFIRGVSMGIDDTEWSEDPDLMVKGQRGPTLTKSELVEISIVDIPNNRNTVRLMSDVDGENEPLVIQLEGKKNKKTEDYLKQKFSTQNNSITMLKALITALVGVKLGGAPVVTLSAADATEADVANGITQLGAKLIELDGQLKEKDTTIEELNAEIKELQDAALLEKATNLVNLAKSEGKITAEETDNYVALATSNYEATEKILKDKKPIVSINGLINSGDGTVSKADEKLLALDWDDAAKENKLETIKAKFPERYAEIFEAKFDKKPNMEVAS